nr:MAG TPA: hypothetical protein [Caudoviricetes sp.]
MTRNLRLSSIYYFKSVINICSSYRYSRFISINTYITSTLIRYYKFLIYFYVFGIKVFILFRSISRIINI